MALDWTSIGLAFASVIGVPAGAWGIKSIINLDKEFTAHELVDKERFSQIAESLARLETKAEAHDVKLDRAIERLPARKGRS
jgi:hypothetical protein